MNIFKYTVLDYYGEDVSKKCGYCKGIDTSCTYGMWGHSLHPQEYQNLIDRGWRRSGSYLYKPKMEDICCPLYTIRCEALRFQPTKSQKKSLKKFRNFIINGKSNMNEDEISSSPEKKCEKKMVKPGIGADPNKPPCRKAKQMRLERKLKKQEAAKTQQSNKIIPPTCTSSKMENTQNEEQSPKESFHMPPRSPLKLELPSSEDIKKDINFESKILKFKDIEDGIHKLTIKLVRCNTDSKEFLSNIKESFNVYRKYQSIIHEDPFDKIKYDRYLKFLVKNPLEGTRMKSNPTQVNEQGAFHMQYILDGKIIAVGVLDILPYCVSSVYFYYDPDFSFLNLGTVSSQLEIELVQQLHQNHPNIEFYYMGYYIHSCPKMRYKGAFKPSYLLCPVTYTWVSIETSLPKIDRNKFSKLSEECTLDKNAEVSAEQIKILKNRKLYSLSEYLKIYGDDLMVEILQWARFVGKLVLDNTILLL